MVKILVCGNINHQWEILIAKVDSVNQSSHGPFHVLFISGKAFNDVDDFNASIIDKGIKFSIPTYIFDFGGLLSDYKEILPENLFLLQDFSHPTDSLNIGMCTIPQYNLTVGFIRSSDVPDPKNDKDDRCREIHDICLSQGYRGCDILLSSTWPRDVHQFLPEDEIKSLTILSKERGIYSGMKFVGEWANMMRPRYHFTSEYEFFYQRRPYKSSSLESKSGTRDKSCIYTRFISLAQVSESKDKEKKWLHALSFDPIIVLPMKAQEFREDEIPAGTTENPYISVGAEPSLAINLMPSDATEPIAKRIRMDKNRPTGSYFFGGSLNKDYEDTEKISTVLVPPNSDAKRLFVGGLAREVSDEDLLRLLPGASVVKRTAGKSYGFVDFIDHEAANKVVIQSCRKGFTMHGRGITIGWANPNSSDPSKVQKISTFSDPSTLFIGGLPPSYHDDDLLSLFAGAIRVNRVSGKNFAFLSCETRQEAEAIILQSQSYPIIFNGYKLSLGWAKGDNRTISSASLNLVRPSAESKTIFVGGIIESATADDIQSIFTSAESIRRPEGKDYAFVEFGSTEEAEQVMSNHDQYSLFDRKLVLGWAQGKPADKLSVSSHAGNCWFCLASPTIAVHLIVSVGSFVYLALPKGGVVDFHVLIIPIECIPSRIHLSTAAKAEFQKYELSLQSMIRSLGLGMIIFERAIRTKGRDHMQEHVIPIPTEHINNAPDIIMQVARRHNLLFHEIDDNRDIDEIVLSMDGGPYQEYFYISILSAMEENAASKRFVYVHKDKSVQFPMFFGNEVSAKIIQRPERSNWKNCVVSESEENRQAEHFRSVYESYDFTLQD